MGNFYPLCIGFVWLLGREEKLLREIFGRKWFLDVILTELFVNPLTLVPICSLTPDLRGPLVPNKTLRVLWIKLDLTARINCKS